MATEPKKASSIKKGSYIMINDEPCRVASIATSRPGKHGHAKHRIVGIGVFDGQKREYLATHDVESPVIEKKSGQVLAVLGSSVQVMDAVTFETFELPMPSDVELDAGLDVDYIEFGARRKITYVKS